MRKRSITKVGAVLLALATVLAGCGSADSAKENGASNETVAEVTSEENSETETAEKEVNDNDTLTATAADATVGNASSGQVAAENFDDVEPFTIRVGICANSDLYYLKVLDEHTNFFADYGITYETSEFAAGINTIDALTINQLDIGLFADYAGVNRIGNTVSDTHLKTILNTGNNNSYALYVNPEKIKSGEDLKGANLVSMPGVVFEYEYGKAFEYYGIDPADTNIVNVSSVAEAVALAASGEGDSFWASESVQPQFEAYGWQPLVDIATVDARMYTFLVSTSDYLDTHQREVAKFLKATREGLQYIDEHQDEVAEWVNADTGYDKELFKKTWNELDHNYQFKQDAYDDLVKVKDWCYKNGNFDTDYKVEDFIDTSALSLVYPDSVDWKPQ